MENKQTNPLDYNYLLDRLYLSLPPKALESTRFELPAVDSILQGKQTIWKNFSKCAKDLNREEAQLYKFVMKEISTSSSIVNGNLVLNGIFNTQKLNQTLEKYIKFFVLCSACKKPDTEFIVQNHVRVLKCTACGAISPIPRL